MFSEGDHKLQIPKLWKGKYLANPREILNLLHINGPKMFYICNKQLILSKYRRINLIQQFKRPYSSHMLIPLSHYNYIRYSTVCDFYYYN
jgi:hypothetical protein